MNDIDMVGESQQEEMTDPALDAPLTRSDSLFSLFKIQVPVSNAIAAPAVNAASSASENGDSHSRLEIQSHIRSSIELSKSHLNDGGRRKRLHRNALSHQQHQQHLGMLHFRKKSFNRTRTAMLQRFQDRSVSDPHSSAKNNTVVSIAALKAALSDSPRSYLDNGDLFSDDHQEKTVFVSEYI